MLSYIAKQNPELLTKTGIAVGVTMIVCYFLAPCTWRRHRNARLRATARVRGQLSFLRPARHHQSPSWQGWVGSLVGADLLHLSDVRRIGTGMASIGGAGTFDGIVLSGIIAAYLA